MHLGWRESCTLESNHKMAKPGHDFNEYLPSHGLLNKEGSQESQGSKTTVTWHMEWSIYVFFFGGGGVGSTPGRVET